MSNLDPGAFSVSQVAAVVVSRSTYLFSGSNNDWRFNSADKDTVFVIVVLVARYCTLRALLLPPTPDEDVVLGQKGLSDSAQFLTQREREIFSLEPISGS